MADELRILAINGSPRKANTDRILAEALKGAAEVEGVVTEAVFLRKQKIEYCIGCFKCFDNNDNDYACQVHRDDMDPIYEKLAACHGLLIASPVYFGGMTAQTKTFMDRTEPLLRYAQTKWNASLRSKVGAAITIGGNRNGGQETTLQSIHHFFFIHDMVVVGTGSDGRPGCYLGAAATTHPQSGRIKDAVLDDQLGLEAARLLGRRLGQAVRQWFAG